MREGILSLTPVQADRDFMTVAAPLVMGAAEKLKLFCGTIRRVAVRYDKVLLVFYRTTAHLSLEPKVEEASLDRVGGSVRKLELVGCHEESKEE